MNSYLIGGEKTKNELAKKGRKSGTLARSFIKNGSSITSVIDYLDVRTLFELTKLKNPC
jgi:hypothetical protein